MENEDDILNLEFDPKELQDIDEDALLGNTTALDSVKTASTIARTISRVDGLSDAQTSGFQEQASMDSSLNRTDSGDEEDDEEDQDDKDRSKFHSERPNDSVSIQRPSAKRTGIPDSLDNVKIDQKDAQFSRSPPKRRRDNYYSNRYKSPAGAKKILLNPHFQGSVAMRPQMRLAWDVSDRTQPIQMGAVKISPVPPTLMRQPPPAHPPLCVPNHNHMPPMNPGARSVPPPLPSLMNVGPPGPPMPPAPRLPMTNIPSGGYRYPLPVPLWSSPQPSIPPPPQPLYAGRPMMGAPPHMYGSVPNRMPQTTTNSVLRPLANYFGPPPNVHPSAPPPPKPLNSLTGLTKPKTSDDWLDMTEAFLRKTQLPPSLPSRPTVSTDNFFSPPPQPKPHVSRQRQAAADVKRKYLVKNDRHKKQSTPSSDRSSQDGNVAPTGGVKSVRNSVDGVDADYLKKLEEQKRLREQMIKNKEQRRAQMQQRRQEQHQPSTGSVTANVVSVVSSGSGLMPIKRAEISSSTRQVIIKRSR